MGWEIESRECVGRARREEKHFVLLTHSLPQASSGGGPMSCWAITKTMLEAGHRVTVISLEYPGDYFNTAERRETLKDLGADLVLVETTLSNKRNVHKNRSVIYKVGESLRSLFQPVLSSFFPTVRLVSHMKALLQSINPDAILAYHWDSLAAIHGLNSIPRMVVVDDLWHLRSLRRWQQTVPRPTGSYLLWTLRTLRDLIYCPRFMVELLNECESSVSFQAYSAAWLRKKGARRCAYLGSPIVDRCGPEWENLRGVDPLCNKPKILLGPSNLAITSTSAGLCLFANEILPFLEQKLGPKGFEVHIVGEGDPPSELARVLPRPSIKMRGRIEPADTEFLSSDVQLVPTPFVLGMRKRIVVAFSFGCCVVAHRKEAVTIPELVDNYNALLASDGRGLAQAIVRAIRDPALRQRLGRNARRTYEEYFHPSVTAVRIVAELERLSRENAAP